MKKFGVIALVVGLATASCSGHGGSTSALPTISGAGSGQASQSGMHSTRAASSITAPAGWAATGTQAIALANASDLGILPSSQPITVHVALQLRNVDQAKQAIAAGTVMDPATFQSNFAPTSDQVAQVTNYLQSQGFSNITTEPNNLIVSATASADKVASAFNTEVHGFTQNGVNVYANTKPAFVPTALGGTVIAVLGLNNAQAAKTGPHAKSSVTPTPTPAPTAAPVADSCKENAQGLCVRFYDPATFELAYDAAPLHAATNTSIAIMTEGQLSGAIADFRTNEKAFNMSTQPISIVQVQPMSSDTAGSDEWVLDMTYSQAMAGSFQTMYLYNFASLSDADITMGYNKWVTDNKAKVANSSFGGCEVFPYQDGSMLAMDEILVQAAVQGQTMFVSTGDTGAYCGVAGVPPNGAPGGVPMVEYPASSPYAVAVGGTDLFSNPDGTYLGETAWEAGGGGLSQFEYSPYWESPTQPVGTTAVGLTFRGLPDVAMDASIETGAKLYTSSAAVNGSCTPCTTGGTSLASPLAAGSYARMQSSHGNTLGFAPIRFYRIYTNNPNPSQTIVAPPTQLVGGFHDILSGSNGAYTALPRYDYTTGMGSFDVAKTNAIIGQ